MEATFDVAVDSAAKEVRERAAEAEAEQSVSGGQKENKSGAAKGSWQSFLERKKEKKKLLKQKRRDERKKEKEGDSSSDGAADSDDAGNDSDDFIGEGARSSMQKQTKMLMRGDADVLLQPT